MPYGYYFDEYGQMQYGYISSCYMYFDPWTRGYLMRRDDKENEEYNTWIDQWYKEHIG